MGIGDMAVGFAAKRLVGTVGSLGAPPPDLQPVVIFNVVAFPALPLILHAIDRRREAAV